VSQDISQRLGYHKNYIASRSVIGRIRILLNYLDFSNKNILDIGCSGGAISREFSIYAKHITAIDADEEIISQNLRQNKSYAIENIDYKVNNLMEISVSEKKYDIVLMLSVLHHVFSGSDAYSWNDGNAINPVISKLKDITIISDVFVIELGMPYEGYDWSVNLPYNDSDVEAWLLGNIFIDDWNVKKIFPTNSFFSLIIEKLYKKFPHGSKGFRFIKMITRKDIRDIRPMFIFTRN
jgi:SAM-dependent methyltransferase